MPTAGNCTQSLANCGGARPTSMDCATAHRNTVASCASRGERFPERFGQHFAEPDYCRFTRSGTIGVAHRGLAATGVSTGVSVHQLEGWRFFSRSCFALRTFAIASRSAFTLSGPRFRPWRLLHGCLAGNGSVRSILRARDALAEGVWLAVDRAR